MELIYASDKIKIQCTSMKAASKLFGGDAVLARSLLARMNALQGRKRSKILLFSLPFIFINWRIKMEGIWRDFLRLM